jgi:hypothetical protein
MECGIRTARIPFIITTESKLLSLTIAGSPLDGKLKTNPVTIRVKTK